MAFGLWIYDSLRRVVISLDLSPIIPLLANSDRKLHCRRGYWKIYTGIDLGRRITSQESVLYNRL